MGQGHRKSSLTGPEKSQSLLRYETHYDACNITMRNFRRAVTQTPRSQTNRRSDRQTNQHLTFLSGTLLRHLFTRKDRISLARCSFVLLILKGRWSPFPSYQGLYGHKTVLKARLFQQQYGQTVPNLCSCLLKKSYLCG